MVKISDRHILKILVEQDFLICSGDGAASTSNRPKVEIASERFSGERRYHPIHHPIHHQDLGTSIGCSTEEKSKEAVGNTNVGDLE